MPFRVRLERSEISPRQEYPVAKRLGEALRVPLADAKLLLAEPSVLPRNWEAEEAKQLVEELQALGLEAQVVEVPAGALSACSNHASLLEGGRCSACDALLCTICLRKGGGRCARCISRETRSKKWQKVRVAVLLLCLFGTCLLAWKEFRRRHVTWDSPRQVAVIVVEAEEQVPPGVIRRFIELGHDVEDMLALEFQKYRGGSGRPFQFTVYGPVQEGEAPPELEDTGFWSLLKFNLSLEDYADSLDEAADIDTSGADVRLYVRTSYWKERTLAVEGLGQQHGTLGVVTASVSAPGVGFAWFATVHELLHTQGATDKYGPEGLALVPQGLADPQQQPLYPQLGTEWMSRGRALSATQQEPPIQLGNWVVGRWTAEEIRWTAPDGSTESRVQVVGN